MKKKILYLLDCKISVIGGAVKSTKTIIEQMKKDGNYDISLCIPIDDNRYSGLDESNIYEYDEIKYKNKLLNLFLYKIFIIRKIISCCKPDIIHAQDPQGALSIAILHKFRMIPKKTKCIYTDRQFFTAYSIFYKIMFRLFATGFDSVICTTNINRKNWENKTRVKKVYCVSNVLDENWNEYDIDLEKQFKSESNNNSFFTIGFAGRFDSYKRWDTVKDICDKLYDNKKIKFEFCIATPNIMEEINNFNEYINDLKDKFGDRVNFNIDANEKIMKQFYYRIDMFILTSERESFGRTLIEAMSKNNVVLGTNSGGVPDVIQNCNYLFEVNDSDKVIEIVNKLIKDNKLLEQEKSKFRKIYLENYTEDKLRIKLINIYNNIAGGCN